MKKASAFNNIFRALQYRNFRLFFFGQSISLIGTWMQAIAMGWLVYRMTNSPMLLGLVGFVSQIPAFILSPFAGIAADRFNRHHILIVTQVLAMIEALVMAALAMTGTIQVWHIIVLGVFLGCINSLDIPARQSFIFDMVESKENLSNAIALNSFMFNAARLVGPSIAGILIVAVGEGMCFLINGLSFIAVIISLLLMRLSVRPAIHAETNMLDGLKEGFRYAFGFEPIKVILLMLSVLNLMGVSYAVLMPVFAKDILHGGANTLGFLMAAAGVGALVAAVYLASRKNVLGLARMIAVSVGLFSLGIILFSISRSLWLSIALLMLVGFGFMVSTASCNIILQTISDDDKRGRVMSFYTMAFMGMAPIGSLLAGYLASTIGSTMTLIFSGLCCILAAFLFSRKLPGLKKLIHPIYRKMGIIPEIASGINTASGLSATTEE